MPIRLFLVLFLCVVPGCALLRGDTPSSGQEDFKWVARSDDAPAVDPSQVEVVFFDGQEPLPVGVRKAEPAGPNGRPDDWVELEPDFPTAEAPHRVIGVLGVVSERGGRARSVARLVEAAAQHGAQLLYVTTPKYVDGAVMAVAIHLSDAADDQPTVDALLAQPMADLEGYAPTEQRLELSLDGPRSEVRFLTQPNHCYAARLVLEQTASLSSSSYDFLSLSGVSPEDANAIQAAFTGDPPGWNGRSWNLATKVSPRERQFTTRLGCTLDGGPVEAFFQAPAKAGPLGAGRARLVIYAKPERREVLEQKQAEARRRFEEDRAKSRANARSKCRRTCGVLRVICDRDRSSCAEYRSCLSRNYLRDADCR